MRLPPGLLAAIALIASSAPIAGCTPPPAPTGIVELRLVHHARAGDFAAGAPRTFTNDLGASIRVTKGYVVVSAIELSECNRTAAPWWKRLELMGTAHAHGEEGPTRLATPTVDDLLRADGAAKTLGTVEPPLGSYCRMSVTLGPADPDARDLPADPDLVGTTLYVEGTWRAAGGSADTPFTVRTGLTAIHPVELGDEAAVIAEDGERRTVTLGVAYDQWFDGVDLSAGDDATRGRAVIENAKRSLHAEPAGGHER